MAIVPLTSLRRTRARIDHQQRTAVSVLAAMRRGLALRASHERPHTQWTLSDGTAVDREIARTVIAHPDVIPASDGLFGNTPQTFTFNK